MYKKLLLLYVLCLLGSSSLSALSNIHASIGIDKDASLLLIDNDIYVSDSEGCHAVAACNKNGLLRDLDNESLCDLLFNKSLYVVIGKTGRDYKLDGFLRSNGGSVGSATIGGLLYVGRGIKSYIERLATSTADRIAEDIESDAIDSILGDIDDLIVEDLNNINDEARRVHEAIINNRILGPMYTYLRESAIPGSRRALKFMIRKTYVFLSTTGGITYREAASIVSSLSEFYTIPEEVTIPRGLLSNTGRTIIEVTKFSIAAPLYVVGGAVGVVAGFFMTPDNANTQEHEEDNE